MGSPVVVLFEFFYRRPLADGIKNAIRRKIESAVF